MPIAASSAAVADTVDYTVSGGRITIDFEREDDVYKFYRYSEFADNMPYVRDGAMYAWVLAEQKMILSGKVFTDVQVDVDISPIGKNGKIDSGIYIGASNAGNKMDGINAWEVNIEHAPGSDTYWLKLHRFEQKWIRDEMIEVGGLGYTTDDMHLRVTVKDGTLYAFLNGSDAPALTKKIGETARGMVGLRNFYAPVRFDNFSVVGESVDVDFADMRALQSLAEQRLKDNLAEESKRELTAAIERAEAANIQVDADEAAAMLASALDRAQDKHTLEELAVLLQKAGDIANPDGEVYTANSYGALLAVKSVCESLTIADGEYEISYWYNRLDEKINGLVKYVEEER